MEQLKVKQMDLDAFDIISFDGDEKEYKLAQGHERFVNNLSEQFPNERAAIKNYSQMLQDICAKFPLYYLAIDQEYPDTFSHLGINARDAIASITSNKTLQAVLAGNNLLYAGRGEATPFH